LDRGGQKQPRSCEAARVGYVMARIIGGFEGVRAGFSQRRGLDSRECRGRSRRPARSEKYSGRRAREGVAIRRPGRRATAGAVEHHWTAAGVFLGFWREAGGKGFSGRRSSWRTDVIAACSYVVGAVQRAYRDRETTRAVRLILKGTRRRRMVGVARCWEA